MPATFVGDGAPASEAVFYEPTFTLFAPDDSIYISDTGNNRIRRITPDGIVRTVAGDGRPGFGGDGGPARSASLNGPRDLTLAPDGSLYIADTLNHRVRRVDPEGIITTVAGNGRFSFSGDGGPATLAALNLPKSLALDSSGALFILDSYNRRVRRVGLDGVIQTIAGSEGSGEYFNSGCFGSGCYEEGLAVDLPLHSPSSIAVGPDDRVYIAERSAIRRIEPDGALTVLSRLAEGAPDGPLEAPTPVEEVLLASPVFRPTASGDLFLTAQNNPGLLLDPAAGTLQGIASETLELGLAPSLDRTGGRYASTRFSFDVPYRFASLVQGRLGGEEITLTPSPEAPGVGDPATAGSLSAPRAVAVGPDGSVFVADYRGHRVVKIGLDGRNEEIAPGRFRLPSGVAVDSQGTLYVASADRRDIFRVSPGGTVEELFGTPSSQLQGQPLGIALDEQDRLYIFLGNNVEQPIVRVESDLSLVPLSPALRNDLFRPANRVGEFKGMTVGPSGEVIAGFQFQFSNTSSQVLSVTDETVTFLPMESRLTPPRSLAVAPTGRIYYGEYGAIWALDPDGMLTPLVGFDGLGFHGEKGFDSAASGPFEVTGLAVDTQGRVLAAVPDRGAVFRFDPAACDPGPTPRAIAAVESGSFSDGVRLAGGTLFSIFGVRLGPAEGVGAQLDARGRVTTKLAGTRVFVNGIEAPILFARADQINTVVPFAVDGQGDAEIVVEVEGRRSPVLRSRISLYGPSLFSYPVQGRSYAAMLNEDGSINSAENPAKLGSVIQLFATGFGALEPAGVDGLPAQTLKRVIAPVRVEIEARGQEVDVLYAGSAPGLVEGVVQINCRVPASLPDRGGSGGFIRIGVGDSFLREYLFYYAGE